MRDLSSGHELYQNPEVNNLSLLRYKITGKIPSLELFVSPRQMGVKEESGERDHKSYEAVPTAVCRGLGPYNSKDESRSPKPGAPCA